MPETNGGAPAVAVERRSGSGMGIFVLGVVIGAGLALLYAPQSGAETRRALGRNAKRVRKQALKQAREVSGTVQDAAQDALKSTREALERRLARHHQAERDAAHDGEDDGV